MNPNFQIIDPTQYPGWDDLVLSLPDYSFFHSSNWARVLSETYGYKPVYFTVFEDNKILAFIPVMEIRSFLTGCRGVSLPFSDYCEPIFSDGILFEGIWKNLIDYGKRKGWKYIEMRGGDKFFSKVAPSYCYYDHVLKLNLNKEKVSSGLRDSTYRNVKKAVREGLEVEMDSSLSSVEEFYRLHSLTRKRHGLPAQPFQFFKNIYHHVISQKKGFVALASYQGNITAGAIYFQFGEKAIYKYGAWDKNYQQLRSNNLIIWRAMEWYAENGYQSLSFGRTELGDQGLIQFKSGWGTSEEPINYYRYDLKKNSFVSGYSKAMGFHNKIFRNIPVPVSNKIGALLYKHVG